MKFSSPSQGALTVVILLLSACAGVTPPAPHGPHAVPGKPSSTEQGGISPGNPATPINPNQPLPVPEVTPPLLPSHARNIESSGASAPVLSLVRQAREANKANKPDQASSSLERALRIEPRNPWVWQALASLHLAINKGDQAESEANKSNSLARRNPYIEMENWRVIAIARSLKGDAAGSLQAQTRQEDLQRLLTQPPFVTPATTP